MEVDIRYNGDRGRMVIDLDEFMGMRSIPKFRKLLKLIRGGRTPEEEKKILNYIEQFNEEYDETQKTLANKFVGYSDKVKITEREIEGLTIKQSHFPKRSKMWKDYGAGIKLQKQELKDLKSMKSWADREFKRNVRLKEYFEKCIEIMQG